MHALATCTGDFKVDRSKAPTDGFRRGALVEFGSASLDGIAALASGHRAVEKTSPRSEMLEEFKASGIAPLRRVRRCADFSVLLKE